MMLEKGKKVRAGTLTVTLAALLLLASCGPTRVDVKIVDVYRTGLAMRQTVTVVEMPDGSRRQIPERVGKVGETVSVWFNGNGHYTNRGGR